MKKHYAWVDVAKGIGIVFIVLGHAANTGNVKDYLFSFHIPMLLMLSGIVFSTRDSFIEFTKSRLKRIVVPYFVFSFISIMIFKIIGILKPSITDGMNTDVITNVADCHPKRPTVPYYPASASHIIRPAINHYSTVLLT